MPASAHASPRAELLPLRQLMGRSQRLRRELSAACDRQPLDVGRVHRLAVDLAAAERELAAQLAAERPLPAGLLEAA